MTGPNVHRRLSRESRVNGMQTIHNSKSATAKLTMYKFRGEGPLLVIVLWVHWRVTTKQSKQLETRPHETRAAYEAMSTLSVRGVNTWSTFFLWSMMISKASCRLKLNNSAILNSWFEGDDGADSRLELLSKSPTITEITLSAFGGNRSNSWRCRRVVVIILLTSAQSSSMCWLCGHSFFVALL